MKSKSIKILLMGAAITSMLSSCGAVSYTHLTLPTNSRV